MPSTFDPLLRLELQAVGENATTWGVKANNNFSLIAQAISGSSTIDLTGSGNYVLSTSNAVADESRSLFLFLGGTLTGNRTIIVPTGIAKLYAIFNGTNSSFSITIRGATGTGPTLPAGFSTIFTDGLNAYSVTTPAIPSGLISMWSGSIATIPAGWALCDGTNGTPNLRDRFIVGAGFTYGAGATGGAVSAFTNEAGTHSHSGNTIFHALTVDEMPPHNHGLNDPGHSHFSGARRDVAAGSGSIGDPLVPIYDSNSPTTAQTANITMGSAGGGQGHRHAISVDGAHNHIVATIPPYYALAYIMKL